MFIDIVQPYRLPVADDTPECLIAAFRRYDAAKELRELAHADYYRSGYLDPSTRANLEAAKDAYYDASDALLAVSEGYRDHRHLIDGKYVSFILQRNERSVSRFRLDVATEDVGIPELFYSRMV